MSSRSTERRTHLHCGIFGGAVPNAADELCRIVASLADRRGRVTVPGFYDDVLSAARAERTFMAAQGPTGLELSRAAAMPTEFGEAGFSAYERTTIRPSVAVNGLAAGYQGRGVKAVIPGRARAKVTFRLVPGQEPDRIYRQVCAHLASVGSPAVELSVRTLAHARPAAVSRALPAMIAAANAYRRGFGRSPTWIRSGGTVPVVDHIQRFLGTPVVMMGFALPADRMHSPNERFPLSQLRQVDRHRDQLLGGDRATRTREGGSVIIDCHCHAGTGDGLSGPWDTARRS